MLAPSGSIDVHVGGGRAIVLAVNVARAVAVMSPKRSPLGEGEYG